MTYVIQFELPGLPKMANPSGARSTHWRFADAERKRWQDYVILATCYGRPPKPLDRVHLTLTRFSSSEPDYDGLVRGFKSVVDGLRLAGILAEDRLSNTGAWECHWVRCKRLEGKIRVRVEEVT